jgi:hypothetical protein
LVAAIRRFKRQRGWDVVGLVGGDVTRFDPDTGILTVAAADTYEALPTKLYAAFTWIMTNRPLTPGIFKTDDDMVFDQAALIDTIYSNLSMPYWGVKVSTCSAGVIDSSRVSARFVDTTLKPTYQAAIYCHGAGYWVSARALSVILASGNEYRSSCIEDVCTGFVLNRAGFVPQRIRVPYKEESRTPDLLLLK